MPFSPSVLLESILHRNLLTEDILPVQVRNRRVTTIKIPKAHEPKPFARAIILPGHLWQTQQRSKPREGVVQDLLIHHGVEVTDEEFGAHIRALLLVGAGLVDAQGLAVELDGVHDVGGVLGVGGRAELDEAEALVGLGDAVARHVDVVDGAHLQHDLVDHGGRGALVDVADIDGCVLVLFPKGEKVVSFLSRVACRYRECSGLTSDDFAP